MAPEKDAVVKRRTRQDLQTRPNVIIFLTDDQAYGDLGLHDNPYVHTPAMDAFGREAVEFGQFYVSPVCAPTRASLMTGRFYYRTGVTDVHDSTCVLNTSEVTIAESLSAAGYKTAILGKWHLGDNTPHRPIDKGFDEAIVHTGSGIYPPNSYFDPVLRHNGIEKRFEGYCQDVYVDHAVRFLKDRQADNVPFFLYLPTNLVHVPLTVKEELAKPFRDQGLDDETARLYGMLKSIDDNFGRLLKTVDELGFRDNTIILFTSDNGPCHGGTTPQRYMSGLHGLKGTVYENGIRVPAFIRWPEGNLESGRKIHHMAAHIDVMPTLLHACRVDKPKNVALDGVSLLTLLQNPSEERADRTLFFQWDGHAEPREGMAFAVRNQRYKLVQARGMNRHDIQAKYAELCQVQGKGTRTLTGPPMYELFDIENDPCELNDISEACPEKVKEMKRQYGEWFEDVWKSHCNRD